MSKHTSPLSEQTSPDSKHTSPLSKHTSPLTAALPEENLNPEQAKKLKEPSPRGPSAK
jgi:hypothetical protein